MLASSLQRLRYRAAPLRLAVVGVVVLATVFLAQALEKGSRPQGNDVTCFLSAAQAIRAGTSPYLLKLPIPYNYPLFAGSAAVPLTYLPVTWMHVGCYVATWFAAAAACLMLVRRACRDCGVALDRGLIVPLTVASCLLLGGIQNHLLNGQTDALVLLLCTLFWCDWTEGRERRAAFWLGLAVSLKLVPALFFLPLVCRGRWSTAAQACGWILALSVGLPALFLGADVLPVYAHYAKSFLSSELTSAAASRTYPHSYTVFGAVSWLVPAWKSSHLVRLSSVLVVVVPLCWVERRRQDTIAARMAALEMYLAAILLIAPISQPHHLVLLLPSAWLLALRWLATPGRSLRAELLDLTPFVAFPLWKLVGGPIEAVAVAVLCVRAGRQALSNEGVFVERETSEFPRAAA